MRCSSRRVVITGIGLVTPLGVGTEANWSALMAGRSGIGPITRFDASQHPVRIAGQVPGFDAEQWFGRKDARKMDAFIQYAVAAARLAVEDAGLPRPLAEADQERTGVQIGVGVGGMETLEEAFEVLRTKGPSRISPFTIPRLIPNMAAGQVSIELQACGPNLGSVSACATGAHSVGDAARLIATGDADCMIAGGAEAAITSLSIAGFAALRALSRRNDEPTRASRPFDKERDGFVAAEGAGVLVLEALERATARGARIYAEVAGYGQSGDACHMTAPHPEGRGAKAAMRNAIADAGLSPDAIGYLNAHGTSTEFNDAVESLAIKAVFGDHARRLWVSSTKSMTGHMLGAAGAVEAAYTALTLHRGEVPPTINYEHPDPECDLDYVPNEPRHARFEAALSNSFGFGGANAALVLRRV
jgi:3-oxoacyl-[acyl-carrier-protein] synthase II